MQGYIQRLIDIITAYKNNQILVVELCIYFNANLYGHSTKRGNPWAFG